MLVDILFCIKVQKWLTSCVCLIQIINLWTVISPNINKEGINISIRLCNYNTELCPDTKFHVVLNIIAAGNHVNKSYKSLPGGLLCLKVTK